MPNIQNFSNLKGNLLTLKSATAAFRNEPDIGPIETFEKHDCFEFTGRGIAYGRTAHTSEAKRFLFEATIDDSGETYWVPLRVYPYGTDQDVRDTNGNPIGPDFFFPDRS